MSYIVSTLEHQAKQHLPSGETIAGMNVETAFPYFGVLQSHLHDLIQVASLYHQQTRHDFRCTRRIKPCVRILLIQGFAAECIQHNGTPRRDNEIIGIVGYIRLELRRSGRNRRLARGRGFFRRTAPMTLVGCFGGLHPEKEHEQYGKNQAAETHGQK